MSSLPEFLDTGRVAGQKVPAKAPERSNFSHKCSMLSQYLKEKGTFGDLSLGMTCGIDANGTPAPGANPTMSLFPVMGKSSEISAPNMATPRDFKSMDLFPQQAGFLGSSNSKEEVSKKADPSANNCATMDSETAQLTIFYAGQVIVFNDFPADKAKEVMLLAGKGCPKLGPNGTTIPVDSGNLAPSSPTVTPNFGSNTSPEGIQQPPQSIACDLPIARKASLQRFLAKRKDRIAARAPYDIGSTTVSPSKPAETKPWLGLAAQSSNAV
ncbi:protein TIFY 10A [Malania oleifera]|uniref:protein TIFY 10A n=1 Tax=Malania oleifera TaxID=397392 RepID=UPI0025AEB5C6|nr:protein TIFY 10A [Malania oleifera]